MLESGARIALPASSISIYAIMKSVSMYDQIGFPAVVETINIAELGGLVSLYADGSVFNEKSGRLFAPEKEDHRFWQMRQEFDRTHSISASDRYLAANRERSYAARCGMLVV